MRIIFAITLVLASLQASATTIMDCTFMGIDVEGATLRTAKSGYELIEIDRYGRGGEPRKLSREEWDSKKINLTAHPGAVSTLTYDCDAKGWFVDYKSDGYSFDGFASCANINVPGACK